MNEAKSDINWNYCSKIWKDRPCVNKARYKNGSKCSTCSNREAAEKYPKKVAKYRSDWSKNNPEKNREKCKRWRDKNKEYERLRVSLYRLKNPEKIREYNEKVHNPRRRAKYAAERALFAEGTPQASAGQPVEQGKEVLGLPRG